MVLLHPTGNLVDTEIGVRAFGFRIPALRNLEPSNLESRTKDDYKVLLEEHVLNIAKELHPGFDSVEFKKELQDIIYQNGDKDILEWTETPPMTVVHGDLHPRQIVYKSVDEKNMIKIVDLKNVKYGAGITDFAFLQDLFYNYENNDGNGNGLSRIDEVLKVDLYQDYLDRLDALSRSTGINVAGISNIKDRIDWRDLRRADMLRQIYWNMRVADKILCYNRRDYHGFGRLIKTHLRYSRENFESFIDSSWNEEYPQARKLYELVKDIIFKDVKNK